MPGLTLLTTADERPPGANPQGKKAASEADVTRPAATAAAVATASGGFGLWDGRSTRSSGSPPCRDHLLARKEAGDAVPEAMLNQALNRLQSYLTDSQYGER